MNNIKYAIVPYPIPEILIKSGLIAQKQETARKNNSSNQCIISYVSSFNSIFTIYPNFDDVDALNQFLSNNSQEWDSAYIKIPEQVKVETSPAFADKIIQVNGEQKSLFKRVHGLNVTIPANSTGFLDFTVPYVTCKFSGANIFGAELKDTLDFLVLDTPTNTYSGVPVVNGVGNFPLNQFGFDVEMPPGGVYENTSNYDADLYQGMVVSCAFKNNSGQAKYISMNLWLHEVK